MVLSSILEAVALFKLWKHNQTRGSIYGISFDFVVLTLVQNLTGLAYQLAYLIPHIKTLYNLRSPVHPLNLSFMKSLVEIPTLVISGAMVNQIYRLYGTKRDEQSVSVICMGFLLINFVILMWILFCSLRSRYTLNLLDLVEDLYLIHQQAGFFKLWPQGLMNFIILQNNVSNEYINWNFMALGSMMLTKLWQLNTPWYSRPINSPTFIYIIANSINMVILKYQKRGQRVESNLHRV
ncbi:hypothetical protein CLIB1444_03S01420 [[Candida] jaroonii]|uniref:Uncharacterized protein n=1 Tax=[Candida] jaroonii TaxID=467808 RepID=A0ACA9Y5E4_9ASCO|nr:hypothetical protein CLIB1444_03S01420 [[Candida] jaroonii]